MKRSFSLSQLHPVPYSLPVLANQITLIGVGLLGGSLGLALQEARAARKIVAYVRRLPSVAECTQFRVAHHATQDLAEAVRDADLIILCTPLAQMLPLAQQMAPFLKPQTLITDVGSVKASVVHELDPVFTQAQCHFVGSHPMAGGEKMGMNAARADLFRQAMCVITPTPRTPSALTDRIEALWKMVGGIPLRLSPENHDELVCRSSHLPHVVAAELAHYILSPVHPREQAMLCAGGFRDTTRVASGSPEMWRDICLANRRNLARILGVYIESLEEFRHSLEDHDGKAIEEFFQQAKERRDQWTAPGLSSTSPCTDSGK